MRSMTWYHIQNNAKGGSGELSNEKVPMLVKSLNDFKANFSVFLNVSATPLLSMNEAELSVVQLTQ